MTLSKWAAIQNGKGPAVLIYLCGTGIDADKNGIPDLDEAIMAALPGVPIARTGQSGYGASLKDLDGGLAACGGSTVGALVGYSAGCQGVRAQLWNSIDPACIVCIDGTAGPWPLGESAREVQVWRDRIRKPDRVSVFTATSQRYTQRLVRTATQPQGPFAGTSTVLARVFDWEAAGTSKQLTTAQGKAYAYPGEPQLERHNGGTHAYVFNSSDCDHAAHVAQLLQVMPAMLAKHVAPALGVASDGGILEALAAPLEAIGRAIGARLGEAWQAAVDAAAPVGEPSHGARCAVAELYQDAVATGTWHAASEGIEPEPGDLLISARAGGDPTKGGQGHVEMAIRRDAGKLISLGGNEADAWNLAPFNLKSPDYRGFIRRDPELGRRCILIAMAEFEAGVREVHGPASNPRVSAYLGCCRRGGSPLAGMPGHESEGKSTLGAAPPDSYAWCAAAQSWCTLEALK
jgi:hypothetical protein